MSVKGTQVRRVDADDVAKVANLLAFVRPSLPKVDGFRQRYSHMGALLADVALQSSLNYASVVLPRVQRIGEVYGDRPRTSQMLDAVQEVGADRVLGWRHPDKPRRFMELLYACREVQVETVEELGDALSSGCVLSQFARIRGIGPKSLDYLQLLAGVATVAIDRHMSWFLDAAGVRRRAYEDRRDLMVQACESLGVDVAQTEHALWRLLRQL
jgi:hypothetical protein